MMGNKKDIRNPSKGEKQMKNKALFTTLALGAAYLLRNEESRNKLMGQFKNLGTKKEEAK